MIVINKNKEQLTLFDPDEEEALADFVLGILTLKGLAREHYDDLVRYFRNKAVGNMGTLGELLRVYEISSIYEATGIYVLRVPELPFRETVRPSQNNSPEWRRTVRALTARTWKDVWKKYPQLHEFSEFSPFPGDYLFEPAPKNGADVHVDQKEFWNEVERQKNLGISDRDAFLLVKDYMPISASSLPRQNHNIPLAKRLEELFLEEDIDETHWDNNE